MPGATSFAPRPESTMLSSYIQARRESKDILIMAHIVVGYPTAPDSERIVDELVAAGVDLVELQLPFSEPIADGPVILAANQAALASGIRIDECLEIAGKITSRHPSCAFLAMTYYNILLARGVARTCADMRAAGLRGAIVPDLPPEEAGEYLAAMAEQSIDPVFIFSPNTSSERMRMIASHGRGFVYCVARKGVTGAKTSFSESLDAYLARCRAATSLPIALGFGVESREDVSFLRGKADIAVVGSQTLRVVRDQGVAAAGPFMRGLVAGAAS